MTKTPRQGVSKGVLALGRDGDPLVVDACRMLESAGFSVTTVHRDRSLLHRLLEASYDTVLLDSGPVQMDLVTLVRQVMRIRGEGNAIVIATDSTPWLEKAQLLTLDGLEVLVPPVTASDLVQAVVRSTGSLRSGHPAVAGDVATYRAHLCRVLQIMADAMAANTYADVLKALATNLRQVFPSRAVGILDTTGDESIIYVNTPETESAAPVGRRLAVALRKRYETLCGRQLKSTALQERIESAVTPADALVSPATETDLILPFLGDGEVRGVLGISNLSDADYREGNLPLVHILASRLHPVLSALVKLKHMAFRDGLTGLYNRTHMEDAVALALQQCRRYGRTFCVVLLDVDHLKLVNDEVGHQAGDRLLREFSRLLLSKTRASDTVGRLGGDEFLVLLPDTRAEGLRCFLDRLFAAIAEHALTWGGQRYPVRASAGAAIVDAPAARTLTAADVTGLSDAAMYDAKRRGKACWTVWNDRAQSLDSGGSPPPALLSGD